ncbi:MFS transporter [Microbulbifer sp. OS29]|uniref:MFS transporter n=1 Tax=Microbulbifer okhotskensis TaxID=2926617 RepID=A0A9X2J6M6_9GAMM|nr:MFS transporter [Microbulbifer okhotskensis]MCO1336433.1 MFS transporter [Microbulbifer okhotskensis]
MRRSLNTAQNHQRKINIVVASQGAAQVVLLTQIPLIVERCGLSLASIGGLVALGTFCLMIAGPLWGEIGDRIGRKPVLLAGLIGALLAQCLFVGLLLAIAQGHLDQSNALLALAASRIIYGLNAAAIFPCCQAWAIELGNADKRLSILSSLSAAANLGRGLGPLLALPALLAGALWPLAWLILLPLAALLLTTSLPQGNNTASAEITQEHNSLPPGALALFATALLGTVSIGQLQVVMGPALKDLYGLSALGASSTTAVLLAAVAICGFLVQVTLVRKLKAPQLSFILGTAFLCAGSVLLSTTLGSLFAAIGLLIFVVGIAFLVPGYSALLSQSQQRNGRLFGLLSLMHTGGYTVGFAIGGWLYEKEPQQPLLGMLISVCLIAVFAIIAIFIDKKKIAASRIRLLRDS